MAVSMHQQVVYDKRRSSWRWMFRIVLMIQFIGMVGLSIWNTRDILMPLQKQEYMIWLSLASSPQPQTTTVPTKAVVFQDSNHNKDNDNFDNSPTPVTHHHVVFLGDSLLRYSFLEWLGFVHNLEDRQQSKTQQMESTNITTNLAPLQLIHEKHHDSWQSFFKYSTEYFLETGASSTRENNIHIMMKCDCRRGPDYDLSRETENRYYLRNDTNSGFVFAATYLQGYGDNMAHGRYLPHEVDQAEITNHTDTPRGDTWAYLGADWDQLLIDYVAKLQPTPTVLVMNAGFCPNEDIARKLSHIFRAAQLAMGVSSGRVHWRATTKMRDSDLAFTSSADVKAQELSFRLPWVTYEPFPNISNLTKNDYMDDKHFSSPRIYREWNQHGLQQYIPLTTEEKIPQQQQNRPSPPQHHRMFLIVGAARTLNMTIESYMINFVYPLCPPPHCVAHLVVHLSTADNRPDIKSDDPMGQSLKIESSNATTSATDLLMELLHHASSTTIQQQWSGGSFLYIHQVEEYEIGSPQEQAAMDLVETEVAQKNLTEMGLNNVLALNSSSMVRDRLHLFRKADPRRYSMWFARYWAWRTAEQLATLYPIDLFAFTRPDLLWMIPAPTVQFFQHFGQNPQKEVWVHDSYYASIPDTFAIFTSQQAASAYFSITNLVRPNVACLGGPNFNQTLVKYRLAEEGLFPTTDDWCKDFYMGWSELILGRKLHFSGLQPRLFPAGTTILRPPTTPLCEPVYPRFQHGSANWHFNYAPYMFCKTAEFDFKLGYTNMTDILSHRPFQLRGKTSEMYSTCLSLVVAKSSSSATLVPEPCEYPIPIRQMFVGTAQHSITGWNVHTHSLIKPTFNSSQIHLEEDWIQEPCELYGLKTFEERKPEEPMPV